MTHLNDIPVTTAQIMALENIHRRTPAPERRPFSDFIADLQSTVLMDDAVVIPYAGMFLAVETDGYIHS